MLLSAAALGAAPAHARNGVGLYAPFPSAPAGGRAGAFAGELGVAANPEQLARGALVDAARRVTVVAPVNAGVASERSGLTADGPDLGGLVGGLALALIAGGLGAHVARRAARG